MNVLRGRAALLGALLFSVSSFVASVKSSQSTQEIAFGTVRGTVTREGSSEAIPDVQIAVSLSMAQARALIEASSRGTPGIPAELLKAAQGVAALANVSGRQTAPPLTATTDSAGHFSINVPPGEILIGAQREGYFGKMTGGVYPAAATATAIVSSRDAVTVNLTMLPGGTISGHVAMPDGKPMPHGLVGIVQTVYRNGQQGLEFVDGRDADDRGEFRLGRMAPGTYYVVTIGKPPAGPGVSAAATTRETAVTTYYPNALDVRNATPIVVRPGDDVAGINLQQRTSFAFNVSGRVDSTLPPGSEVSAIGNRVRANTAALFLLPRDPNVLPDATTITTGAINANTDGTFTLPGVLPGSYDLYARLPVSKGWGSQNPPELAASPFAFGHTQVDVQAGDMEGVTVVVHPGVDVNGRVLVDGSPAGVNVRLSMQPDGVAPVYVAIYDQVAQYQPTIAADGSFTFPLMLEGRYRLQVVPAAGAARAPAAGTATTPLATRAYLADIQQNGVSVFDNGIVVGTEPVAPIDVMFKTDGATVDGVVTSPDRKPAAGATVVLVPALNRRQNPALFRTATVDTQGHFILNRVGPGDYKVFAWDTVLAGAYQNAEFMRQYEAQGAAVTVRAGIATSGLTLTPIRK